MKNHETYSQESVFPSLGRISVELFGVNSYWKLFLCIEGPNCSEISWEVFG